MSKLPQGWVECELKDIAIVKGGKRLPKSVKYSDVRTNHPYIRVTDFNNLSVNMSDLKYLTEEVHTQIKNYIISCDDVYISIAGSIGKVGTIPVELNGANLTENAAKIVHNINKLYLSYFLNSTEVQYQIKNFTKSTTQPKLALYRIEELSIKLPPLNEQKRIVEKIESEFEKIDKGLEHLTQAKEQIKQYKQSVLKAAFDGKLYKTTEWDEKQLVEISNKITDGSHNPPPKRTYGIPMLSGQNIKNGQINFDDYRYINEEEYEKEYKRTPIEYNDVLLTIVGTIGEVAVVKTNEKFALQRSVALIKSKINPYFIKYFLMSNKAKHYFKTKERGTAQKGIYLSTLKELIVPVPQVSEQQKIVEEIEKRFEAADKISKVVDENIEKAKQLKQSILKKAFEGRLVPQDPTDEPASVLLEKIKSGKR